MNMNITINKTPGCKTGSFVCNIGWERHKYLFCKTEEYNRDTVQYQVISRNLLEDGSECGAACEPRFRLPFPDILCKAS